MAQLQSTSISGSLIVSGSLEIVGNLTGSLTIEGSGSTVFDIQGSQGQLFSVTDSLSGSLMSVNDISGLPIFEVFSDDRVVMGEYGTNALVVSGSKVGVGTASPAYTLDVSGSSRFAGDLDIEGTLTAREFKTELVSASILYQSGSTKFGDTSDDVHSFSGSLRVTGSGNHYIIGGDVGIGTTSPAQKLHVNSGGAGTILRLERASTLIYEAIIDNLVTGDDVDLAFLPAQDNSGYLFRTRNSSNTIVNALSVNGEGNVGIGTSSPVAKLNVVDGPESLYFSGSLGNNFRGLNLAGTNPSVRLDGSGNTFILSALSTGLAIWDETDTSYRFNILNNGNVGIGTASPRGKLTVGGGGHIIGDPNFRIGSTGTGNTPQTAIKFTDTALTYYVANGIKMFMSSSGNIGIGTTTPGANLDVRGSAVFNEDSADADFRVESNGNANMLFVDGGNDAIGIGTNSPFTVGGTAIVSVNVGSSTARPFSYGSSTDSIYLRKYDTANYQFQTTNGAGNSGNLSLQSYGGNVGIGTTSPSYKLEVNGSFAATTKSFIIDHPTKENKKLVYGVLEGPEHAVYCRGKVTGELIELPEEWTGLVDEESITVQLTPIGKHQKLFVEDIKDNKIFIKNGDLMSTKINAFYFVQGTRKDVKPLETVRLK